jgi:hypothetical protein
LFSRLKDLRPARPSTSRSCSRRPRAPYCTGHHHTMRRRLGRGSYGSAPGEEEHDQPFPPTTPC